MGSQKTIIGLIVVAIVVILIILLTGGSEIDDNESTLATDESGDTSETEEILVNALFQEDNGNFTVVGEITVDNTCDAIVSNSSVDESRNSVSISLTTNRQDRPEEDCVETPTPRRFTEEFSANPDANISLSLDGEEVRLNLQRAATNEDLSEFQFNFKG